MRYHIVSLCALLLGRLGGQMQAAEPVLINKSMFVGGDFPQQYRPEYPLEARSHHITGSGVFILHVDRATGAVKSITVQRSTGYKILDNAVLVACIHWQFKPHAVTDLKLPITFSVPPQ
jgi:TonB family protein